MAKIMLFIPRISQLLKRIRQAVRFPILSVLYYRKTERMMTIFHRFRPLWLGVLITLIGTFLLAALGVILIDPAAVGENLALFTL